MEAINIDRNIQDFKQVFEAESRIIFSAKFGDGKSYFLKKFIESYPKEDNDYYFITLHPVNYVVEDNKDVIEYIKRDILFQLIKDDKIYDYKDGIDKIFDSVCNIESLDKLADFLSSILPVPGLADGYKKVKKLLKSVTTICEKYKGQSDLNVVDDYLNGFYGKNGSISECDAFTCLIQKTLEHQMAKSVLIIEDLDRIDPAHLFRIMNVLSSQVDNPYYSGCTNENKFGFDKIILVMDYDMAKHIFHHFYGEAANYDGYMNKFLTSLPFRFSISEEAHRQVEDKMLAICKTEEALKMHQQLSDGVKDRISVPIAIKQMSVRRCKEFLDIDIDASLRENWLGVNYSIPTRTIWSKILVCYRFLFSDKSLGAIQEAMLYGFSDTQLAEFYAPFYFAINGESTFYMKIERDMYDFCYSQEKNTVRHGRVGSWQSDKIVNLSEIRNGLRQMNHYILNLLIG